MHVIWHDHIAHQQKLVSLANHSQRAREQVSRANCSQQRQPAVTTEGDKMQIAAAVITFQILGHERPQEPTCNPDTWGTQCRRMLTLFAAECYPLFNVPAAKENTSTRVWATRQGIAREAPNAVRSRNPHDCLGFLCFLCCLDQLFGSFLYRYDSTTIPLLQRFDWHLHNLL